MNLLFSILGLVGGILCAIGDILFDLKGKGNKKLGTSGNIDSNWEHMAYWRFGASISAAFAGDILLGFGFLSLVNQIWPVNAGLAVGLGVCGYVSVVAGFFIHSTVCIQPIIYKKIMEEKRFALADTVLEQYYKAVMLPFVSGWLFILSATVCVVIAVLTGCIAVPKWFVLLNPVVFLLVGMGLRKWKPAVFYDLPGIILPSLGLGMFGLIGIVGLVG